MIRKQIIKFNPIIGESIWKGKKMIETVSYERNPEIIAYLVAEFGDEEAAGCYGGIQICCEECALAPPAGSFIMVEEPIRTCSAGYVLPCGSYEIGRLSRDVSSHSVEYRRIGDKIWSGFKVAYYQGVVFDWRKVRKFISTQ